MYATVFAEMDRLLGEGREGDLAGAVADEPELRRRLEPARVDEAAGGEGRVGELEDEPRRGRHHPSQNIA